MMVSVMSNPSLSRSPSGLIALAMIGIYAMRLDSQDNIDGRDENFTSFKSQSRELDDIDHLDGR